jgi:hypothetical protein
VQCNSFEGVEGTSVTAVGARRGLMQLPVQEDVGLVGIHHQGKFYDLTPKDSEISWDVDPWGRWACAVCASWLAVFLEPARICECYLHWDPICTVPCLPC